MGAFFTAILAKVAGLARFAVLLVVAIFAGAWDMIRDLMCWGLEQVLTSAQSSLASADMGALTTAGGGWGALGGDVLNVLGLLGMGDCMAVIVSAIAVRIVLQLIPFTRLGS